MLHRRLIWPVVAILFLAAPGFSQDNQKRVTPETGGRKMALVIGNKGYKMGALGNSFNDADDMKGALESLGFHVDEIRDADFYRFQDAIETFTAGLRQNDVVFFYYSGHGMAIKNENFLLPVDFAAKDQIEARHAAILADVVQERILERGPRLAILVLDACRDNPYLLTKGFGNLAPPTMADGFLIAFAAGLGQVAFERPSERNSLYTKHLLAKLREPGLSVSDLFRLVKDEVRTESKDSVRPALYDQVNGNYYFIWVDPKIEEARKRFELIRDLSDPAVFEAFLRDYPDDVHAGDARNRIAELRAGEAAKQRAADENAWKQATKYNSKDSYEIYLSQFPKGAHSTDAARLRIQAVARDNNAANLGKLNTLDDQAWQTALSQNTKEGYEEYLRAYPTGQHAREATNLKNQFIASARAGDEAAWRSARGIDTVAGYDTYVRDYPDGAHKADANRLRGEALARQNNSANLGKLNTIDDQAWQGALSQNTVDGYQTYLRVYPDGQHIREARTLRDQLNANARAADEAAWRSAHGIDTVAGYDTYVRDYPDGAHKDEAGKMREAVLARLKAADERAWDTAARDNTIAAYELYLRTQPNGAHGDEARARIDKLKPAGVILTSGTLRQPHRHPLDKSDYVWVPGGTFEAGCTPGDKDCSKDEPKRHKATLPESGFWIGQTEVTVKAFKEFIYAHPGRKMPKRSDDNHKWEFTDHPMINVSWEDAKNYCEWVGGSLPSGDQWERAARGGKDTRYPWGDQLERSQAKYFNRKDDPKTGYVTAPVKTYDPNGYGLYDVSGNVWEWTTEVGPNDEHAARGGSWDAAPKNLRVTAVRFSKGDLGTNGIGFRCALNAPPANSDSGK